MLDKQIYSSQVRTFKKQWCNENEIIPNILKEQLGNYLDEPILDVGAGMGDIANIAYNDKETTCIDLVIPNNGSMIHNPKHQWVQADFFSYVPKLPINTIILSHVQQFLDDDLKQLNSKVAEIQAKYIIIIMNENDGLFGKIVEYTLQEFPASNPEVCLPGFPVGYSRIERVPFTAQLACDTIETLAEQIGYLMVNSSEEYLTSITTFLHRQLSMPQLNITQAIEVYAKQ